jgi:hypothetical protein
MKLRFNQDKTGIYGVQYKKGDELAYTPYQNTWQGMTEPERVEKGIFVICYGHGEFNVFKDGAVSIV